MRALKRDMNERFAQVEESLNHLANQIDRFMKLYETVDIEMRLMKEPMKRFEDRLAHPEATQAS
jgi:archaellum component FlaC